MNRPANQDSPKAPKEPDLRVWLTSARLENFKTQFLPISNLLATEGLIRSAISAWARYQTSLEIDKLNDIEENEFKSNLESWKRENQNNASDMEIKYVAEKMRILFLNKRWARQNWGSRLENLYLSRKENLDRASCRLLRYSNKDLGMEIYHRLKAGEINFAEASLKFGEGQERFRAGVIPLQAIEKMPPGLGAILQKLEPGSLSMPLVLNKGFCIVKLEEWQPSQLDQETKEFLLGEQFSYWINALVDRLMIELNLGIA